MGPDQRKKVEMLHNCTYGYAIGVFVDGKPMKKKDVDCTLLKRQFMTAHKPAVPQSFLSTMTANVVSTCRNTAAALSADFGSQETAPTDEAAKPMYAFPANEEVVEVIRHTNDLSEAEKPVYDSMANLPAGFNAQYNVVANNKRYEFFNDAVASAIQDNADANPTNCDAPADIRVEIELADGTIESRIVEMVPDHIPHTRVHGAHHVKTSPRLHGDS
jgi:hypothetical protein